MPNICNPNSELIPQFTPESLGVQYCAFASRIGMEYASLFSETQQGKVLHTASRVMEAATHVVQTWALLPTGTVDATHFKHATQELNAAMERHAKCVMGMGVS